MLLAEVTSTRSTFPSSGAQGGDHGFLFASGSKDSSAPPHPSLKCAPSQVGGRAELRKGESPGQVAGAELDNYQEHQVSGLGPL